MGNEILLITIGAILVNNYCLEQFLGMCPFLGITQKTKTALGMSGAVIFVMTITCFICGIIYNNVLTVKYFYIFGYRLEGDLGYLKVLVFIVVIASLVQIVELVLEKAIPPLYDALGIYLPLITTNCAVLAAPLLAVKEHYGVVASTAYGFFSSIGFALALFLMSGIRERVALAKIPDVFKGTATTLIIAGLLSMGFMGFAQLVK